MGDRARGSGRLVTFLGLSAIAAAVGLPALATPSLANSVTGSVSDGADSMNYRLFQPTGVSGNEKVPLVLFLHGLGDRGTDNVGQTYWMDQLEQHTASGKYAAYVLAPQASTNMWWGSGTGAKDGLNLAVAALKQAMANPHVDTSRVYVTGVSMGAFGVWDLIARDPKLFAAAAPLSGSGNPATASSIDTPVWAFHGNADNIVNVAGDRAMVAAMRAAGKDVQYTEVAGGDHFIWPSVYSQDSLYQWMFGQHLGTDPSLTASLTSAALPEVSAPSLSVVSVAQAVPEPAAFGVVVVGLMALGRRRRR